jgi:hypothetical protein
MKGARAPAPRGAAAWRAALDAARRREETLRAQVDAQAQELARLRDALAAATADAGIATALLTAQRAADRVRRDAAADAAALRARARAEALALLDRARQDARHLLARAEDAARIVRRTGRPVADVDPALAADLASTRRAPRPADVDDAAVRDGGLVLQVRDPQPAVTDSPAPPAAPPTPALPLRAPAVPTLAPDTAARLAALFGGAAAVLEWVTARVAAGASWQVLAPYREHTADLNRIIRRAIVGDAPPFAPGDRVIQR